MAPHTAKLKKLSKNQLIVELNKMYVMMDALKADAQHGIDAIRKDIEQQTEILTGVEEGGFAFGRIAQELVAGLPLREFAIKATIGFMWGYTLGAVGNFAYGAMMLLALPAWVNFVMGVLIAMALIYIAFTTVLPISNFAYNTVAKLTGFVKREALAARKWVEQTTTDIREEQMRREAKREQAEVGAVAH